MCIYLIHYRSICVFISYTTDPHMYLSHTLQIHTCIYLIHYRSTCVFISYTHVYLFISYRRLFITPTISHPLPSMTEGLSEGPHLLTYRQILEPDPLASGFGATLMVELPNKKVKYNRIYPYLM